MLLSGAHKWVVNLHKYMILYGLKFSKEDHVLFIRILYGLLTTRHVDTAILDAFAKVNTCCPPNQSLIPASLENRRAAA
jgi:proteasome activator subunit 4